MKSKKSYAAYLRWYNGRPTYICIKTATKTEPAIFQYITYRFNKL